MADGTTAQMDNPIGKSPAQEAPKSPIEIATQGFIEKYSHVRSGTPDHFALIHGCMECRAYAKRAQLSPTTLELLRKSTESDINFARQQDELWKLQFPGYTQARENLQESSGDFTEAIVAGLKQNNPNIEQRGLELNYMTRVGLIYEKIIEKVLTN